MRYLRITIDYVDEVPPGSSLTDWEGFVDKDEVTAKATEIWDAIFDDGHEEDPELWTIWLHTVHAAMDAAEYEDFYLIEILIFLERFLGKDRGVFLTETAT